MLAYTALLSGAYTRPDREIPGEFLGQDTQARLQVLKTVAQEKAATTNQVILAWMLHSDPFVLPLIASQH